MEFTFEESPWEQLVNSLEPGMTLPAMKLLPALEEAEEDAVQEALDTLEQKGITLDVSDLPGDPGSGDMAVRLRQEQQLAASGNLLAGLEAGDPLRLYLEELAATPVAGDIRVLAENYLRGDERAAQKLTDLSLSRVVELSCAMTGRGVLLLDLIQEGGLGLWQGILSYTGGDFEESRDWWIRQYLARAVLLQARSGGLGQKLRQGMEDYRDVDQRLLSELGRNPTLEEIAEAMHIDVRDAEVYANMMTMAQTRKRIEDERAPKEPAPEDEQAVEDTAYFQMRQRITELLSTLEETDAKLLSLRFGLEGGLPLSPEDTGRKLGLTPQEVVEREAKALLKLRNE